MEALYMIAGAAALAVGFLLGRMTRPEEPETARKEEDEEEREKREALLKQWDEMMSYGGRPRNDL